LCVIFECSVAKKRQYRSRKAGVEIVVQST
jgi:hypothetical protein